MPAPDRELHVSLGSATSQTARMLQALEPVVHDAITSPTTSQRPTTASRLRFSSAAGEEHSSSAEAWSVRTRLSSSGIARSNERIPASTWATGTPPWAPASAPASVEFVSP